jgi:DNA invertase Pin-like site-specific DNA recombinase
MERELLIERTQPGLAAAQARGRLGGRRRSFTADQRRAAQRLYDPRVMTMDQIAAAVGSSPSTIYRDLVTDGRRPADQP